MGRNVKEREEKEGGRKGGGELSSERELKKDEEGRKKDNRVRGEEGCESIKTE